MDFVQTAQHAVPSHKQVVSIKVSRPATLSLPLGFVRKHALVTVGLDGHGRLESRKSPVYMG